MMAKPTQPPTKPVPPLSPQNNRKWHVVLSAFLQTAGLQETIRGFEADLLVLSRAQHDRLQGALKQLSEEVSARLVGWILRVVAGV